MTVSSSPAKPRAAQCATAVSIGTVCIPHVLYDSRIIVSPVRQLGRRICRQIVGEGLAPSRSVLMETPVWWGRRLTPTDPSGHLPGAGGDEPLPYVSTRAAPINPYDLDLDQPTSLLPRCRHHSGSLRRRLAYSRAAKRRVASAATSGSGSWRIRRSCWSERRLL